MAEALQGQFLEDCQNLGIDITGYKATHFTSPSLAHRNMVLDLFQQLAQQAYISHSRRLPWHMQREQEFLSEKRRKERKTTAQKYLKMNPDDRIDKEVQAEADKLSVQVKKTGEDTYCVLPEKRSSRTTTTTTTDDDGGGGGGGDGDDDDDDSDDDKRIIQFQTYFRYDSMWCYEERRKWLPLKYMLLEPEHAKIERLVSDKDEPDQKTVSPQKQQQEENAEDAESVEPEVTPGAEQLAAEHHYRQMNSLEAFGVFLQFMAAKENRQSRKVIVVCTLAMGVLPILAFRATEALLAGSRMSEASKLAISGIVALVVTKSIAVGFAIWAYRDDAEEDAVMMSEQVVKDENDRKNAKSKVEETPPVLSHEKKKNQ